MEGDLRWACRTLRRQPVLHRLIHRQGSPRGSWRKRGELAQDIGRSRGGRTSKVHAVVDEHGRPRRFVITGGQVHDSQVLPDLLEGAGAPLAVVADKAYGSRAIRQLIADDAALAVIPSKSNAREPISHDPGLYKMRNIVERFFCTMKDMRRLATRFEKLSCNFLAMIHIFAIRLWIN
jgi:transposase